MTPLNLDIDLDSFDDATSIGLREARELMRGRKGRVALEVARRWTNPAKGCRPQGKSGPLLVLPAVRIGGELRTMREWVERFERQRQYFGRRPAGQPPARPTDKQARENYERAERRLDERGCGRKGAQK